MTRHVLWAARIVAVAAAVASVHGMHAAVAATPIGWWAGWLWPIMTDGLAVVAWAATQQLRTRLARGYAWSVLLVAVAVSGVAQAVWLGDGGSLVVPRLAQLIGGWPAIAVITTALLVWLLARSETVGKSTPNRAVSAQVTAPAASPIPEQISIDPPEPTDLDQLDESEQSGPPDPPDRTEPDHVLAADLVEIVEYFDRPLTRKEVMTRYGVGSGRADRLRASVEQSGPVVNGAAR